MCKAQIDGVSIKRILSVIVNPNRYRSKAAEAFCAEILPEFTAYPWSSDMLYGKKAIEEAVGTTI
jgi:hypothetical protein